jgi:hypothetical protein
MRHEPSLVHLSDDFDRKTDGRDGEEKGEGPS